MSHNKSIAGEDDLLIGRNHWDVPVRVELRAYFDLGGGWIVSCGGWCSAGGTRPPPNHV